MVSVSSVEKKESNLPAEHGARSQMGREIQRSQSKVR